MGGVRRDLSRPPPHRGRLRSAIAATVVPAVLQPGIEVGRTERPAAPRPFSCPGQIARARRLRDGAAGTTGVGCLLGATTRFGCPRRRIVVRNKDISRRPVPIWPSNRPTMLRRERREGAGVGRCDIFPSERGTVRIGEMLGGDAVLVDKAAEAVYTPHAAGSVELVVGHVRHWGL